jgi:hypothetical protein
MSRKAVWIEQFTSLANFEVENLPSNPTIGSLPSSDLMENLGQPRFRVLEAERAIGPRLSATWATPGLCYCTTRRHSSPDLR